MRAYISSDKRFTPKRAQRVIEGHNARIWINGKELSPSVVVSWSMFSPPLPAPSPDDDVLGWVTDSRAYTERWYIAWSNPTTGEEGRGVAVFHSHGEAAKGITALLGGPAYLSAMLYDNAGITAGPADRDACLFWPMRESE